MEQKIYLPGDHPWHSHIHYFHTLPSTNDYAKVLSSQGAPEGTAVIAGSQSAGRGRMGRSFHAPEGLGLYLSLILRPGCEPGRLMHLTCAAAVAACNAVEQCAGIRPQIKWINDLILQNKKLGGILTELSVNSKTGLVDWAVIGIGINCLHRSQDFPPELQSIATSLLSAGCSVTPASLATALLEQLFTINSELLTKKAELMDTYRQDCLTVGRDVILAQGEARTPVTVLDVDCDGGLVVRFPDGAVSTVCSGEISIRGLCGYL